MENGEQVHLLLTAPGQPPLALPPSPWRAWHVTERGPVDPVAAAASTRLSPVAPRAERTLVAAVAADDVDALHRIAGSGGPAQEAAQVLVAVRMATIDPTSAIDALARLAAAPVDPTEGKVLRRHWSALAVHVALAPGVPALVGLSRSALALLTVELLVEQGRVAEAVALLETLPPRPAVVLSLAATLLAAGEHQRVLDATAKLPNVDDVTALAYVARSVAARSVNDLQTALDAVCEALSAVSQNAAVIAAGLEERAHLYGIAGEAQAARADLEALTALASGQTDVTVPRPSLLRRGEETPEEDGLDRARHRLRRRITGVGEPGTFGGRHHSTYRDEIATMFSLGQVEAVEDLLICLLDAVEDEVDELGVPLDATFFLTLADLYQDSGRIEDLHALRERYAAAEARARRAAELAEADTEDGGEDAPAPTGPAATVGTFDTAGPETTEAAPPDEAAVPVAPDEGTSAGAPPDAEPDVEPDAVVVVAEPVAATHVEPSAAERLEGAEVVVADAVVDAPSTEPANVGAPVAPDGLDSTEAGAAPDAEPTVEGEPSAEPVGVAEAAVAVAETTAPDGEAAQASAGAVAVDLAEPEPEPEPAAEEPTPEPPAERELTMVERAVRGPRLRSL